MNSIKRQKAKEAIGSVSLPIRIREWEKEDAFKNHVMARQMIDKYNLPYRILLDYFKEHGIAYLKCTSAACKDGVVLINPLYPAPGYYQADLICVDWYVDSKYTVNPLVNIAEGPFKDDLTSNRFDLRTYIEEGTELSKQIESKAKEQITWDLSTAAGRKEWEKQFAHFLNAADLDEYSCFDYWGDNHAPADAETRISYWRSLQADYHMHPEYYRHEEPTCDNPAEYTLNKFYFDYRAFPRASMM